MGPVGALRPKFVSDLEGSQRVREPALASERVTEAAMGLDELGVDLKGDLIAADGPFLVALGIQGVAQVAVRRGELGVDLEGGLVFADRSLDVLPGKQDDAQVAVRHG